MKDFSVYLTYVGNGNYYMFIKNNASEADFIRIIIGYTEIIKGKRNGRVVDSWIVSPLKSSDEHVFIQSAHKHMLQGKRMWVAFEAVKRNKPRNKTLGSFVALSPTVSRWRTTVGSSTNFDMQTINSIKSLEYSLQLEQIV